MDYRQRITTDPLVRGGKPRVRGARVSVADVLAFLGGGVTSPEVCDDFPDLVDDDVQGCLSFAADREHLLMAGAA